MNIDLRDVEIGDKIFSTLYGICPVTNTDAQFVYFRTTISKENSNMYHYCTYDGKLENHHKYANCAHDIEEYIAYVEWIQKKEVASNLKVDDLLIVWNENSKLQFARFARVADAKEKESGFAIACFAAGRDSITANIENDVSLNEWQLLELWKYFRSPAKYEIAERRIDQPNRESLI